MDIRQSHFELFGLPERFALDEAALDAAYLRLQSQVHPDKFVSSGGAAKRVALQWATHANAALQTLRNPLKRAVYLCSRHGIDLETESNTSMAPEFLMVQMEAREALDEVKQNNDLAGLERLQGEWRVQRRNAIEQVAVQIDQERDFAAAAASVRQLMFLEKFGADINEAFELMEV